MAKELNEARAEIERQKSAHATFRSIAEANFNMAIEQRGELRAEVERQRARAEEAEKERDEADRAVADAIAALQDKAVDSICSWCGALSTKDQARAHLAVCPTHPLRAAEARADAAEAELSGYLRHSGLTRADTQAQDLLALLDLQREQLDVAWADRREAEKESLEMQEKCDRLMVALQALLPYLDAHPVPVIGEALKQQARAALAEVYPRG
jgi:hypothetical protein